MSDQRNKLQALFAPENRYPNFGDVLMQIKVNGFRCHVSTVVEFDSPITAFCGLNGTGKSTLLQLAAAAYRNIAGGLHRYYVRDFIVSGTLDPAPFSPDASVEYGYWQEDRTIKRVTITRSDPEKRWRGYKRQPERPVYFAGMGLYLPKVETRDFFVRNAAKLSVSNTEPLSDTSKQRVARILGCSYDAMAANTVSHAGRTSEVVTVERAGSTYSEANMGCGEGRAQHIIRVLETLPKKSLVLLEEPETSLHPSAQHEFGRYLIDVCIDQRHQIMITTHSEYLLTALPSASRIYIDRTANGLRLIRGITTAQAISLMTGGHDKALSILVEDDVADVVLCEILRRSDQAFLRTVRVCKGGDTKAIHSIMTALRDTGLPVAAVRDGDKGDAPSENMFKLPGTMAPERAIFASTAVRNYVATQYAVDLNNFMPGAGENHHEWFLKLAETLAITREGLILDLARVYVTELAQNDVDTLTTLLKESIRR
jgi:predicted ATPase